MPKERPRRVFDALYDIGRYPMWWPQFRQVTPTATGQPYYYMVVRSFLPYRIAYTLTPVTTDRARGVLMARVRGEIEGRIRWQINPSPIGSVVYFEERVQTSLDLLNMLAPFARWLFELNHQVMMRDGRLGLRAYLAATRPAAGPRPGGPPAGGASAGAPPAGSPPAGSPPEQPQQVRP